MYNTYYCIIILYICIVLYNFIVYIYIHIYIYIAGEDSVHSILPKILLGNMLGLNFQEMSQNLDFQWPLGRF